MTLPIPHRLRIAHRGVILAALLFACAPVAEVMGQGFQIEIDYIDISQFPAIKIALHVTDASGKRLDLSASNFHVRENGIEQSPLKVDCTQDSVRPPVSFMLGLDESASMIYYPGSRDPDPDSSKLRAAKKVLADFVSSLRTGDEAALLGFNTTVRTEAAFTANKDYLLDIIASRGVDFGTSLYDAIVEAIKLVSGRGNKKIVIIITDGTDTTSKLSLTDAVTMAQSYQIPVYCIGVGEDVDSLVLKEIARRTNGRFFFAPTAQDLAKMYDQIAQSIFNGICSLSYTSGLPCPDGGLRTLEISFTKDGQSVTKNVGYFAPSNPEYALFRIDLPPEVDDGVELVVPVRTDAALDTGRTFAAEFDVLFDPAVCLYIGAIADSTLAPGSVLDIRLTGPGSLHISIANGRLTRGAQASGLRDLLLLRFRTLPQSRLIESAIHLRNGTLRAPCEAIVTTADAGFRVLGCPTKIAFSMATMHVVAGGEDLFIPIRAVDSLDTAQEMGYRFTFRYDPALLEFSAVESGGAITVPAVLSAVADPVAGRVTVSARDALPRGATGMLCTLVFHTRPRRESMGTTLSVDSISFHQSCAPAVSLSGAGVAIEGACERFATPVGTFILHQNQPNPANPSTVISFGVRGKGRVSLTVFDMMGRPVRTLVDGMLPAGAYRIPFDAGDSPSGVYFYLLREGDQATTKKMIIQR